MKSIRHGAVLRDEGVTMAFLCGKLKCLSRLGARDVNSNERRVPIVRNEVEVHDASKNTVRRNTLGNLSISRLVDDRRSAVKGDREK
jgi:hypothetical protein